MDVDYKKEKTRLPIEIEECLKRFDCTPQYDKRNINDSTIPCIHKSGRQLIWFTHSDFEKQLYKIRTPDISRKLEWYEQGSFRQKLPKNIIFEHKDKGRWISSENRRLTKEDVLQCLPIIINWLLDNNFIDEEIKNMDKEAAVSWVISSNPDIYDSVKAFRELKTIDWRQSEKASFKTGDFVYVYISHKVGAIKFKCVIKDVNIPFDKINKNDEIYYLNKDKLEPAKTYMRLEKIKEYNGCAFTNDYISLFGFKSPQNPTKLNTMGANFIAYLELIERLQAAKEIIPSEYDGSYELVSEVIKSYSTLKDYSACDFNDLNLIYLSTVGTWKIGIDKRKEYISKSNLPETEKKNLEIVLDNLWEKAKKHEFENTEINHDYSLGMFGTGQFNTEPNTSSEDVQMLIKLCVNLLNVDNEETAFSLVEDTFEDGMHGLATGGISQILHCLKPFIFPILNSNSGKSNLFKKLGLQIKNVSNEKYYASNCRIIKKYRDSNFSWKNYRNFDIEDLCINKENEEYKKFKCLLEYFVSHLEYVQNSDTNHIGYNTYIKPYIDKNNFKIRGQGYAGDGIQEQVKEWDTYDCGSICFNIDNMYNDYTTRLCYINWKNTGFNIIAKWNKDKQHIIGLTLHIYQYYLVNGKKIIDRRNIGEIKTITALGLFDGQEPNKEIIEFYEDFKKLLLNKQQQVINELEDKKMEKQIELLKKVKNIIFTGAPGTGKTFYAEEIARAMKAETKIVQFHPSYDYTDFVEGLRPIEKNGTLGFERKDGAFKEFCALALKNLEDSAKSKDVQEKEATVSDLIDEFVSKATDDTIKFTITTGNEFFIESSDQKYIYVKIPSNDKRNELTLQKAVLVDLLSIDKRIKASGEIREFYKRKWRTQEDSYYFALYEKLYEKKNNYKVAEVDQIKRKEFVFIIDEINRGEVSKIFGELFYAIDPGCRGNPEKAVQTQYQNLIHDGEAFKNGFYVPENVYIIGTMNDIDRSVESIDFAFRRRFTWTEITSESSLSILDKDEAWVSYGEKPTGDEITRLKNRLINLNKAISDIEGLNSAYHIGGSYLLKYASYSKEEAFEKLWINHIQGVLFEYLRGRPQIDKIMPELKKAYDTDSIVNEEDEEEIKG